jgi:hypothetical protein
MCQKLYSIMAYMLFTSTSSKILQCENIPPLKKIILHLPKFTQMNFAKFRSLMRVVRKNAGMKNASLLREMVFDIM